MDCVDAPRRGSRRNQRIVALPFRPDPSFISSPVVVEEDVAFLSELKRRLPDTTFVGSGDVYREIRAHALALHPFCDAVLTDFRPDLPHWLACGPRTGCSRTSFTAVRTVLSAEGAETHGHGFMPCRSRGGTFGPTTDTAFPFSERRGWATVLTDFGCPFSCTFCPMSTTGYKLRDIDTVVDELRLLRALGIHEVFFRDQTFRRQPGADPGAAGAHHGRIPRAPLDCWSRVDLVNERVPAGRPRRGCHTVMFGIESANEEILKRQEEHQARAQMEEALRLTGPWGSKSVGTFVLGLPGESEESIRGTIAFAAKLPLDRPLVQYRDPALRQHLFRRLMREQGVPRCVADELRLSSRAKPVWLEESEGELLPNETIFRLQRDRSGRSTCVPPISCAGS